MLYIKAVDACVADVRRGEGDDLLGIRGIGEHLLVACEGGVKAKLSYHTTLSAYAYAPKNLTCLKNKGRVMVRSAGAHGGGLGGFAHLAYLTHFAYLTLSEPQCVGSSSRGRSAPASEIA